MVQTQMDLLQFRMVCQHLEQSLGTHSAQSHIAVVPPSGLMQGNIGEHVNGSFKHKDFLTLSVPVEAVPGVAALQIPPVAFPHGIDPLLVGVSGLPFRIVSHKNGIVVLSAFIL